MGSRWVERTDMEFENVAFGEPGRDAIRFPEPTRLENYPSDLSEIRRIAFRPETATEESGWFVDLEAGSVDDSVLMSADDARYLLGELRRRVQDAEEGISGHGG